MGTRSKNGLVMMALVVVLLVATGCAGGARVGTLQTESKTVELGGAESVSVNIEMGAGELDMSGGAGELLEADFTYNVADLKPEVSFAGGKLTVRTPSVRTGIASLFDLDEYRYEWDLRLNDDVPMDMNVAVGAGRSDLRLGSLSLTSLDVAGGAGEVRVDLSGSKSLTSLDIASGAGALTVDLTGTWMTDLKANIGGGVGEKILILPRNTGVRVKVELGIGTVDASGLKKDGDYYTNDAYGQSPVTLEIEVAGGVGGVELRVGE